MDKTDGRNLKLWTPLKSLNLSDGQAPYQEKVVSLFSYTQIVTNCSCSSIGFWSDFEVGRKRDSYDDDKGHVHSTQSRVHYIAGLQIQTCLSSFDLERCNITGWPLVF